MLVVQQPLDRKEPKDQERTLSAAWQGYAARSFIRLDKTLVVSLFRLLCLDAYIHTMLINCGTYKLYYVMLSYPSVTLPGLEVCLLFTIDHSFHSHLTILEH